MVRGLILNIQRYSLHDGPGIRTTVFLKGCPLSCSWCHNPESQPIGQEIGRINSRCARCGRCVDACPQGGRVEDHQWLGGGRASGLTHNLGGHDANVACTMCGSCVTACPTGARQIIGREMSVQEVLDDVTRDRVFHDQSGGGVTLSGGEPLMQAAFAVELLRALRERSIHTVLDTCGFATHQVIRDVAPWVNLFLYDLKCVDDARHRAFTGVSNALILENLQTLSANHANIWIRIPLVPGFNLDEGQLGASARFVARIPGVRQVNLLPYHQLGTHKRARTTGTMTNDSAGADAASRPEPDPVTQEQIDRAAELFRAAGLRTLIGG